MVFFTSYSFLILILFDFKTENMETPIENFFYISSWLIDRLCS